MNTEITIPVRVQVLKDSIADLQSQLSNLNIDSNSFKTISKYIQSMTQEMTRFEAMTSRSFNSQNQFNKANKSIEKMEDTLSKARIAMNDIKFPELKLSGSQKAEWDNLNKVLNDAMQGFDNVKERVKNGILGDTTAQKLFEGMDSKYLEKSYDQLFSIIDSKTQQLGRKMSDAKQKLSEFNGEKNAHNKSIAALTSGGISPEAIGQIAFDRFFTSTANGIQFKNIPGQRTPMRTQFMEYLKQQFYLDDKDIESLTKQLGEKGGANKLSQIFQKMSQNNMFTRAADSTNFAKENKLHQAVKEAEEAYAEYQKILKKFEDASATGGNGQKAGEVGDAYNKLQEKIKNVNLEMEKFQENAKKSFSSGASQTLSPFQAELNNFKNVLQQTNTEFLKLEQTKRTFTNMKMAVSNFMGFYQVLNLTKRGIKEAMTHIKDLDSVMNKISIVTDKSTSDLWGQVNAYSDMAQKYGVSIKGAYEVSQIYYQQGLDTADVLTLTNETLKLSKISGLDYATTTDYMTTAMRGFKMETSDASRVVDVYSNLAAHTAVSQGELAVGMSKTASSLESVGASFEESSAMIATMVAVTRESSTNIGSAMKSIASRYGEMKKDMSAAFDAEGEAISYNKVDTALQSVGISLKDSNGQFRNMTDVIIELGEQWDTLDSVQQRYIATQFAGNRQQSRFLALVSNVDLLKSNLNYALDSENVGDVQALKALDSIESRTEQLKVAYQQMYTTIGAEDMWKSALSGLTNFMNTLNGMPKLFDKIPIGAAAMLYDVVNVIKGVGNFALEGISKSILSFLSTDEAVDKGREIIDKMRQGMQENVNSKAEETKEEGKKLANQSAQGAKETIEDKTTPAGKPEEVEKITEPAKQVAQQVIQDEQVKQAIEPTEMPITPVIDKEGLKEQARTAIEEGTQEANAIPKQETEITEATQEQLKQEAQIAIRGDESGVLSEANNAVAQINAMSATIPIKGVYTGTEGAPEGGTIEGGRFGNGASGGAYAAGTKKLLGELGPEMYVSNGQYHVAGTNGPEMIDLPDDAIVFNHLQTEDLLKNQKTSSNGKPVTNERKATAMASGNKELEEVLAQILPSPSMLKVLAKKYPIATGFPGVWRETLFGNMAATLAGQVQEKGFTNDFNEQFSNAITQSIASGEIDGSRLITYLKNTLKDMESGVNAAESYATTHPNDSVASRNAKIRRQYLEQDQAWFDQSFGNMSIPEDTRERHQTYLQSQAEIANEKRLQQEATERKEREERQARREQQEQAEMDTAINARNEELKTAQQREEAEHQRIEAEQAEKKQKGIEEFNVANEDFLTAIGKPKSTDWTAGIPIEDAVRLRKKQLEAQEQMLQASGIPRTPSEARIASGQLSGSMIEQRRSGLWSHWTTDKNGNYVGEPLGQYPQHAPGITKNARAGYYMTMDELKAEAELIRRGEKINPELGASSTLSILNERERYKTEVAEYERRSQERAQENAAKGVIDETASRIQVTDTGAQTVIDLLNKPSQSASELAASRVASQTVIDDITSRMQVQDSGAQKLFDLLGSSQSANQLVDNINNMADAQDNLNKIKQEGQNFEQISESQEKSRLEQLQRVQELRSEIAKTENVEQKKKLREERDNLYESLGDVNSKTSAKTLENKIKNEQKAIEAAIKAEDQLNESRDNKQKSINNETNSVEQLKEEAKAAEEATQQLENKKEVTQESIKVDASAKELGASLGEVFDLASGEAMDQSGIDNLLNSLQQMGTITEDQKNTLSEMFSTEQPEKFIEAYTKATKTSGAIADANAKTEIDPAAPVTEMADELDTQLERLNNNGKVSIQFDWPDDEIDEKIETTTAKFDKFKQTASSLFQWKGNVSLGSKMSQWGSGINMLTGMIKGNTREDNILKGGIMAGAGALKTIGGIASGSPMAIATGIMSVFNGISTIIEDNEEKLQRLSKTAEELDNKAKQEKANYKTLENSIKKIDELEEKRYDSEEAAEEYQETVDKLTEKFPELISGFDEFGNAIVDMSAAEDALAAARSKSVNATYAALEAEDERLQQERQNTIKTTQSELNKIPQLFEAAYGQAAFKQGSAFKDVISSLSGDNVSLNTGMAALNSPLISQYAWGENTITKDSMLRSMAWYADQGDIGIVQDKDNANVIATKQILQKIKAQENAILKDEQGNIIGLNTDIVLEAIANLHTVEAEQLKEALTQEEQQLSVTPEEIQSKISQLSEAIDSQDINLINQAYEELNPLMSVIRSLTPSEDDPLFESIQNLEAQWGKISALVQDQKALGANQVSNAKGLINAYIQTQHFTDDFIQEESGLLTVLSNNFANEYIRQYKAAIAQGKTFTWDDFKTANALTMDEAAGVMNDFWTDLTIHGEETAQKFTSMLKNISDYRQSDFDTLELENIDNWDFVSEEIGKQFIERTKNIRKNLMNYYQQNVLNTTNKDALHFEGQWLEARLKAQTSSEGQYLKTIFSQYKTLYEGGFTSDAQKFGEAALSVYSDAIKLTPETRNALWKSIDKNKLETKEGIDKIIKDIEASDDKTDDLLKPMLESMRNLLQDSMTLALESIKDDFVEKWEDSSKTLKSLTSGIDLKDADSILTSEAGKSIGLTLKDFTTNGDNLVLKEQDAQRYMDAYFETVNTTMKDRSNQLDRIGNVFGSLDKEGNFTIDKSYLKAGKILTEQNKIDLNAILGIDEYKKYIDEDTGALKSDTLDEFYTALQNRYKLVSDSLSALGLYTEAAKAAVQKSYQWSKGDYSSLQETFSAKGIENYTSRLRELASGARYEDWELNEPDIKNAIDQMTDGYSALLSDILEKGTENINVNQYKGIISEDISKIAAQLSADMDPAEFVAQYYQMAGWTIKEANQKILDINRQNREEIYDEIKSLQDLAGKPGDQIALNALYKKAQKAQKKEIKAQKDYLSQLHERGANTTAIQKQQELINLLETTDPLQNLATKLASFGATLEHGILTLTDNADMLNIAKTLSNYANSIGSDMGNELQDFVQTIQKGYTDAITKGIEGGMTYTEAADLIRKGGNLGVDLSNADFRKTAEGLQLSSDAAISLYDALSNVDTFSRRIVFDKLSASLKKNNSNYKTSTALLSHINQLQDRIKQQQERITSEVNKSSSAHEKLKERLEREKALASQIALNDFGNASDGWDFMSGEMPGSIENTIAYYQSWSTAMQSMKQWANSGRTDTSFVKLLKHVAEIADATGESLTFLGKKIGGKDGASYSELMQSIMSAFEVDEKGAYFNNVKLAKLGFNMQEGASTMYKNDIFGRIDSYFKMTDEAVTEWNNYIGGLASVKEQMKKDKKEVEDFFTEAGDFDTNAFKTFLNGNDKVKDAWNKFAEQTNINGDTLKSILDGTSKTKLSAEEYNATMKSVFQMMFSEDWDPSNYAQSLAEQWENAGFTGNTTVNGMYMEAREGQVVIQDSETKKYVTPDGQSYNTVDKAFNAIYQAQTDKLEASAQKYGAKTSLSTAANGGQITTYDLGNGDFKLNVQKNPDGTIALSDQDGNNLGTNIDKAIDTLYQNYADKMHETGQSAMSQAEWLADSGLSSGLTQMAQDVADGVTAAFTSLTEAGGPINENGIPIKVKPEFESENPFEGQTFKVNVELNPVSDEIKPPTTGSKKQVSSDNGTQQGTNIEKTTTNTITVTPVIEGTVEAEGQAKLSPEVVGEIPEVKGIATYSGVFPASAPTVYGRAIYLGQFPQGGGKGPLNPTLGGATGTIGLAHAKSTLMGELGPEMVVSNGRYFVVGQNGPEMVDLDKDAIVFNHLQTKSLLEKGTSSTRGRAITSERYAVAYAQGNMGGGPAKAGVEGMLIPPAGGNAPRNSKGILSGLQNAQEKVSETLEAFIKELDKWYNYLQEIARIERDISYQEQLRAKIDSDLVKNGKAYYASLRQSVVDLDDKIVNEQALAIAQENELQKRVKELSGSAFDKLYKLDENGQVKYKDEVIKEKYENTFGQKDNNVPNVENAKEQWQFLVNEGFESYMKYDKSGKEIQLTNEKGEDNPAAYKSAVQAFWDRLDAQVSEIQGLVDGVSEHQLAVLEAQEKQNELIREMQDNQLDLEGQVLDAVVDIRERAIKELEDEKDAYQESADKMINGLTNALNKEREMYEMQEDQAETDRMRRRLAILLSSNGPASEITDLQEQIRQRDKDMYFQEQQQQIDAIKEASDLEIERLDQQIEIQNEILAYQKDNGLLWEDVYSVMNSDDPNKIAAFINEENSKLWANSPLKNTQDMQDAIFSAEKWTSYRDELNGNFGNGDDAIAAKVKAIYESILENNGNKEWENYVAAVKEATGEDISGNDEMREAFLAAYRQSSDPKAAREAAENAGSGSGSSTIAGLYKELLNRAPDEEGLAFWTEKLNSGMSINEIRRRMMMSEEYKGLNPDTWMADVLQNLYQDYFNRAGDAGGLAYWTEQLKNGMWIDELESGFRNSDEYRKLHPETVQNNDNSSSGNSGGTSAGIGSSGGNISSNGGVPKTSQNIWSQESQRLLDLYNSPSGEFEDYSDLSDTKSNKTGTIKQVGNKTVKVNSDGTWTVLSYDNKKKNRATGNAFAKGTLLGELGPEAFVSGGRFHIAGKSGAEFVNLPDDAIVFNHAQTARLLQTGHTSRGDALNESKAIGDDIRSSYIKNFWSSVDQNKATMNATNAQAYMGDGSSALGQIINTDGGVIIEHAEVNMNVEQIANDYDAKRAGEQALEEMLRIARKNSVTSVRR